jgi:hypothetical protein
MNMVSLILCQVLIFMVNMKSGGGVLINILQNISHGKYLKNSSKKNGNDV